jgi:D-sedoheptulose 7-phosphate isomerase
MEDVLAHTQEDAIYENIDFLYKAWRERRQVFIIGNGGSAATASHMANDLSKATVAPGKPRMKAMALTDNVALISAWANDSCYQEIFKEQLANLLDKRDVVLAISASGNSPNILHALEFAKQQDAVTIGWTGASGGILKDMVDLAVLAPTDNAGMIESCHMVWGHLISSELYRIIHEDKTIWTVGKQ